MNVTVEHLGPCRKLLRIEVDRHEVDSEFEKVTSDVIRGVRLPGFRPGKAPRHLVEKTFGKRIEEEVKRQLISDNLKKAVQQEKLAVVGTPDIEEIQFGREEGLQFAATVDTAPEFEMPEYRGLPVKIDTRTVTEEDVDRALRVLQEQRAMYLDVDREARTEDFVVVNYSGSSEGRPIAEIVPDARSLGHQENFWIPIKENSFLPGFSEQLIGAKKGDRRTVTVQFPADFVSPELAGKPGVFEVEILGVKEKTYLQLDDEFAKGFGAENLEKLREGVRHDLEQELSLKKRREMRNQLASALLSRVNFDLPESLVQSETRNVVYDIVRENQQRGVPPEAISQQKDEIYNVANASAKDRLKLYFLLDRIAKLEQIKVEEKEMTYRILAIAQQNQIKPEKLIKQLKERNGLVEIHEQILTSKVFDFLEQHAAIQEAPPPAPAEPESPIIQPS